MAGEHVSDRWARWRASVDLGEYHGRWAALEAAGQAAHGEADLIEHLAVGLGRRVRVLDAGCGMGRVAIELAARGLEVEGVDLDADLLEYARRDAPHVEWHHGDLATLDLPSTFGIVAMPGNVMLFCKVADRCAIVAALAAHLEPGGLLVAGFGLDPHADALTLDEYDQCCTAAGLALRDRWATWDREPYRGGDYAVSVHQFGGARRR